MQSRDVLSEVGMSIEFDAPISTWFEVGGRADRLARPRTHDELRACLRSDSELLILGDGANLLVDDEGVRQLVISLGQGAFSAVEWNDERVVVGAGAKLPQLINESVRRGLSGLETVAGIPATIGGAIVMNAGGAFGAISDRLVAVHVMNRDGVQERLPRGRIGFDYRQSGLQGLIILSAEFELLPGDPAKVRERQLEIMAYKKNSQPMADKSAGCVFKNPTLAHDLPELLRDGIETAVAGRRVSAGMLIDKAGCKGMTEGGASVSDRHANFIVTAAGATARDVMRLMERVQDAVKIRFDVELHPEVVLWRRRP